MEDGATNCGATALKRPKVRSTRSPKSYRAVGYFADFAVTTAWLNSSSSGLLSNSDDDGGATAGGRFRSTADIPVAMRCTPSLPKKWRGFAHTNVALYTYAGLF